MLQILIMSNHSFHVISNSTYAWWAAFLRKNNKKTENFCICPYPWKLQENLVNKEIYYPEWRLIKNALTASNE